MTSDEILMDTEERMEFLRDFVDADIEIVPVGRAVAAGTRAN